MRISASKNGLGKIWGWKCDNIKIIKQDDIANIYS